MLRNLQQQHRRGKRVHVASAFGFDDGAAYYSLIASRVTIDESVAEQGIAANDLRMKFDSGKSCQVRSRFALIGLNIRRRSCSAFIASIFALYGASNG